MVHLRYFKCNGRANESGSTSATGTISLPSSGIDSARNQEIMATKPSEDRTSNPIPPNIANSSSPNQLPISSNRPIHTVSASDGQIVQIIRNWFTIKLKIWAIHYGPIMCGPYCMVHIVWSILYGLYAVDEMEIFIRRTSKYDVSRLAPIPTLDTIGIDLLKKKSNMNSNSGKS